MGNRLRSMRSSLFAMIALALVLVLIAVFAVFRINMQQVLLSAEDKHIQELGDVLLGALEQELQSMHISTRAFSSWNETRDFVLGVNTKKYVADYMSGHAALIEHQYNFVIIKDLDGRVIYSAGYDLDLERDMPIPLGFSSAVDGITRGAIEGYETGGMGGSGHYERTGILLFEDQIYFVCTLPVLDNRELMAPVGTFSFALLFDEARIREITNIPTSGFAVEATTQEQAQEGSQIRVVNDEDILFISYLTDITGAKVKLTMTHPRSIYNDGTGLTLSVSVSLFLVLAGVLLLLYLVIDRSILKRMKDLSSDVQVVGPEAPLDMRKYSQFKELGALSGAINDMAQRFENSRVAAEKSQMSITVLQNILNSMDAFLYVSDPETDEILFINDKMKQEFALEGDIVGQVCWQVLQDGFSERCSFCPVFKLDVDPEGTVEWEEHNTVTGHHYHNIDRYIDWTYGRRVHLQHSQDITDIKLAEAMLEKRLEQQKLSADLSQHFISGDGMEEAIQDSLRMTGEFMGIGRVMLVKCEGQAIRFAYEWRGRQDAPTRLNALLPLDGDVRHVSGRAGRQPQFNMDDLIAAGKTWQRDDSLTSYVMFPILVQGQLWGALEFDQFKGDPYTAWTQSEVDLGDMVAGVLSGVLNRRHMEGQLERLSSIVEGSPQYISLVNREGQCEYFNPAAAQITGYTVEELREGGFKLLYNGDDHSRIRGEILPEILSKGNYNFELTLNRRDGEQRLLSFSGFKVGGEAGGYGAIAVDITERRKLEQALIDAKVVAENSSMAKGEFLSRMSHEMRTPMNAIIGMTNIARASQDPARKEYCLEKIEGASHHLLGVINDILDMSKIDAGKFELNPTDFNFERMLMGVVNVINFRVEEKRQRLMLFIDPKIPQVVLGDEQRLAQVITNLITNACKFTPDGGKIELSARLNHQDGDVLWIRVDVQDNGIGITEEQQSRLFKSFEQADGGIARRFGGTGLGLAISKRIVELMGGEIWVQSALGEGSTFSFTASLTRSEAHISKDEATRIHKENLRILAVDDMPDALEYIRHVMHQLGADCDTALSGKEALGLIQAAEQPYDVMFIDWSMPGMNGIELTREIRRLNPGHPIIIMVSVAEWSEIEKDATEAGVSTFIPKPLFPSQVAKCINSYFDERAEPHRGRAKQNPRPNRFEGRRILLAEDVEINREIVITLLEGSGLIIDEAQDGQQAVDMFSADPRQYDLILMDIQMPEVDGYEATKRIRAMQDPWSRRVPILAMTANAFREDVERCMEAGMDGHIAKPIDVSLLLETLDNNLRERKDRE